jgi:hypothetical protein
MQPLPQSQGRPSGQAESLFASFALLPVRLLPRRLRRRLRQPSFSSSLIQGSSSASFINDDTMSLAAGHADTLRTIGSARVSS